MAIPRIVSVRRRECAGDRDIPVSIGVPPRCSGGQCAQADGHVDVLGDEKHNVGTHQTAAVLWAIPSSLCYRCVPHLHRYKSFSQSSDNIGDITAKGEAQTAVIDLLGMCLGIRISRSTNLAKAKIVMVFLVLSIVDLLCVYQEIRRSVVLHDDYLACCVSITLQPFTHFPSLPLTTSVSASSSSPSTSRDATWCLGKCSRCSSTLTSTPPATASAITMP